MNNSFGEGLEPEERDRIANLAIDALRRGAEGKKLFEKTDRLKQVKTSRIGSVKADRSVANQEPDDRQRETSHPPSTLRLRPEIHRLLSGRLKPEDLRGGRVSPNMLRLLMGGTVPRVKGATRLVDIAKRPLDPID